MAKFEVFIPSNGVMPNVTLRVDADNWIAALKGGMAKLGEQGAPIANLMCDVKEDNSIHVTDPSSGRVFRIQELSQLDADLPTAIDARPLGSVAAPSAPEERTQPDRLAPVKPVAPAAVPQPARPGGREAMYETTDPEAKPYTPAALAPAPAPAVATPAAVAPPVAAKPAPAPPPAKAPAAPPPPDRPVVAAGPRRPSGFANAIVEVTSPTTPAPARIGRAPDDDAARTEATLEELFDSVQVIWGLSDHKQVVEKLLDLAMQKIPADAGSVFLADLDTDDLAFAAVRGPKAKELLRSNIKIPMGVGVVGFCALEGVGVAISDAQRDPRFYQEVGKQIGYDSRSLLCAPIFGGGRTFGCIELVNKQGSSTFTKGELSILAYLSHQAAEWLGQHWEG